MSEMGENNVFKNNALKNSVLKNKGFKKKGLKNRIGGAVESFKKVITASANLLNRCLPKPFQKIFAAASIVIIVVLVIVLLPETEQSALLSGENETGGMKSEVPNFNEIPAGRERKAAFFNYFLPIVEYHNRKIQKNRLKLDNWSQNRSEIDSQDASEIGEIAARYRITDFDIETDKSWNQLLNRVDVVPPSLALAQSANESAWGTSRFARNANNFFGQWCFKKGCGLVPEQRDANKAHEVAAFDSPQKSVEMYIRNLNSNSVYKPLRDIRSRLRESEKPLTGHALAAGLTSYSERGQDYITELREMIEFNKLTRYDNF